MKKLFILLLVIIAICWGAVYTLPTSLKKVSQTVLSEVLQTEVMVEGITFSIPKATFNIQQVTIKDYPKFSQDNLFVMKNLNIAVDPQSLLNDVITIKNFSISNLDLKLTGGLKNNSLKELQHVITLREEFEQQQHANHMSAEENHNDHNHNKSELKLRIERLHLGEISLAAKITEPLNLPEKSLTVPSINIINIGKEQGLNVHSTVKVVTESLDMIITKEIEKLLPAQKVYEETKQVVEQGINEGKKLLQEAFSDKNIEKSKQKADELINKLF